ncbi:MAG TPA: alkaline phosphatase D family protein [Candidatus Binatia bacterium]
MLTGAGLAMPGLFTQSSCAPLRIGSDRDTGLSLCYVAGDVTPDGAIVWLRAEPGSEVMLHYSNDRQFSRFASAGPFRVDEKADYTVKIELQKLDPGTTYFYYAAVTGKKPGYLASFLTAPAPADAAKVSFCFSGDSRESYQPFTIMNAVRAQRPNFFLHLGDTIYADFGGTARKLSDFWAKYRANRNDPATQLCFFETSTYVVWDDHEVVNNFFAGNRLVPTGRKAFFDYWPIRRHPSDEDRIYRSFRWGKALELFLLDTRQYRDPGTRTMLGTAQKDWLFKGLAASSAMFKFVATSVPMAGGGIDRWDGYPEERAELLRLIRDKRITGVVFLSADLHYAAVTSIPKSKGLKDITAGPLAAPLNRVTDGYASRFDFFLAENFNFAKITVDPAVKPAQALVEFIDQDNAVFHTTRIKAV